MVARVTLCLALCLLVLSAGCMSHLSKPKPQARHELTADVEAGRFPVDLYLPQTLDPAPLVIVAHGWTRSNANMSGWGKHLAEQGFAAAVPTLPTWSDHPRNGRAVAQLIEFLNQHPPAGANIDCSRVALVGFSAGGLATFLAAGEAPQAKLWIGLDPVDRRDLAVRSAGKVRCRSVILRAEPRAWNHYGNWAAVESAAPSASRLALIVNQATHADCEWPTDPAVRWSCGDADPQRQQVFIDYATASLRAQLLGDPSASEFLERTGRDPRVRLIQPETSAHR